jgi:hypothetical protein
VSVARRRLAITVRPAVLADALTAVLADIGADDVVNLTNGDAEPWSDHYDAALVTEPEAVVQLDANVVILLPAPTPDHRDRRPPVSAHRSRRLLQVQDLLSVLDVLDEYCPAPVKRRS